MVSCADGIVGMDDHGQGVDGDGEFHRFDAVCLGLFDLLVLHLARGVGDVHRAVDQGGDARARTAAGDGNGDGGIDLAIGFGPGQRQIDQRVGAFVLDRTLRAVR